MPKPRMITVTMSVEDAAFLQEFLERAGKGDLVLARYKTVWARLAELFPNFRDTPDTQTTQEEA
jgi:hypothetical protein